MIKKKNISIWLFICCFMVVSMIMIGGYTRLSDAGLSIVEWKPISGILPPIGESEWNDEFQRYAMFPEYKEKNFNITLSQFKNIYWIEYLHRLLGRVTGIVFFIPFLYFAFKRLFSCRDITFFSLVFLLGGAQGFVGWYMVKSGLNIDPAVSHYRLTVHLLMAIFIYGLLLWKAMSFFDNYRVREKKNINLISISINIIVLCVIQIALGGMVAGLDAGLVYNTFPLMGDQFVPSEVMQSLSKLTAFDDPVAVQFLHRIFAFLIIIYSAYFLSVSESSNENRIKWLIRLFGIIILCQFWLGIMTLLGNVPLNLAIIHQFVAIVAFTNLLFILHNLIYTAEIPNNNSAPIKVKF